MGAPATRKASPPRAKWLGGPGFSVGTPGGTRTPNLLIRSQTLYPIEDASSATPIRRVPPADELRKAGVRTLRSLRLATGVGELHMFTVERGLLVSEETDDRLDTLVEHIHTLAEGDSEADPISGGFLLVPSCPQAQFAKDLHSEVDLEQSTSNAHGGRVRLGSTTRSPCIPVTPGFSGLSSSLGAFSGRSATTRNISRCSSCTHSIRRFRSASRT